VSKLPGTHCPLKNDPRENVRGIYWESFRELRQTPLQLVMATLCEIIEYTNDYLRVEEIADWPNALNGLQIENSGKVTKLGAAVDVSTRVLTAAAQKGIDLLIVHHGLFWPGLQRVTGSLRRQLKIAFENDIALYSAHLPLDVHSKVGNNPQLAAALGLKSTKRFLKEKGQSVGLKAKSPMPRSALMRKLKTILGSQVKAFNFGPKQPRRVGIVTGAAGSEIYRVAEAKIDTFVTGEAPHWAAVAAEELSMNLVLGGHYATETLGVKALAAHLSSKFQLPFEFLDFPTGL
jgi:dinuclear metal center YbgI/SA1388 family protein